MRIDILTLFPEQAMEWFSHSILKRARAAKKLDLRAWNMRDWGFGRHNTVDDTPYGGGAGMLLKVDVVVPAINAVAKKSRVKPRIILLTPQGRRLTQALVEELAQEPRLLLVAGHYEGFDERIRSYVDDEISLGDFVLTGGEIAAVALTDAVARLVPGVLDESSPTEESHSLQDEAGNRLLEYPHYTRPEEYDGHRVPDVLLSGHHAEIKKWRHAQAKPAQE
jgi:tRNA (guanine37-N1)-methyltransferase